VVLTIFLTDKCCRSPPEEQDQFIFDLFALSNAKDVSKDELLSMVYNLPSSGVI
jgi:hypothetical protein